MEDTDNPDHHNPPLLPPDYVSLADLQQRWHRQQQQQKIKHPALGDPSNDGPHKPRINGQPPRRSPEFASPRSIGRSGDRKEFSVVKVVPQSSTLRDIGGGGGREKRVKDEKFIKERGGKKGMQSESLKGEYIVKGKVEIDGGDRNGNEKGKKGRQSEVLKVGLVKEKLEINGGDRKGTEKMKNGVSGKKGMQSEPLKVEHVLKGKVGIDGGDWNGNEKMKNEVNGKKGMQSEPLKVEHVVKGKGEIDVRERNGKKGTQAEMLRVGHFVNRKVEFNGGNGAPTEKMMGESSEERGMQSERSKVGEGDGGDPTEGKNKKKKKKKRTKKKMGEKTGRNLRGNGGNGDEKEVDEKQEAYDDRTLQTRGMVAKEDGGDSTVEKEDSGHRVAEVWRRVGRKAGGDRMAEIGWKVEKEDGGDRMAEIGPRFEKLNVNRRGWGRGVRGRNWRRQTDGIEERRQVYRSYGRLEHRGMERENGMVWVKKGEVSEQK